VVTTIKLTLYIKRLLVTIKISLLRAGFLVNVQMEEIFEETIRGLIVTFRCLLDGMTRLTVGDPKETSTGKFQIKIQSDTTIPTS
jgi:hypothetical protein